MRGSASWFNSCLGGTVPHYQYSAQPQVAVGYAASVLSGLVAHSSYGHWNAASRTVNLTDQAAFAYFTSLLHLHLDIANVHQHHHALLCIKHCGRRNHSTIRRHGANGTLHPRRAFQADGAFKADGDRGVFQANGSYGLYGAHRAHSVHEAKGPKGLIGYQGTLDSNGANGSEGALDGRAAERRRHDGN